MTPIVLISWANALGVTPVRLVALAAVAYLPMPSVALLIVLLWRQRPPGTSRASTFCAAMSAELRAGSVLRDALRSAAHSSSIHELDDVDWYDDMDRLGADLAEAIPEIGEELRLTVASASRSGSSTALLFDELGSYALAMDEVKREIAMATAPARATAALLIGAPFLYLLSSLSSGDLRALLDSPSQRTAALVGVTSFVIGLTVAALILWRASR